MLVVLLPQAAGQAQGGGWQPAPARTWASSGLPVDTVSPHEPASGSPVSLSVTNISVM